LIGRVLEGAWRATPPPLQASPDDIADVTPLLTGSGAASLGWWRVSAVPDLAAAPEADRLHDAARLQAIGDAVNQRSIEQIAAILNAAGVTPLVFKGWAAARHYAETWLRPYGDFDLLIASSEYTAAQETLWRHSHAGKSNPVLSDYFVNCEPAARPHRVDLHRDFPVQYATPIDTLFSRALPITLPGGASILVPCPEDHLRIVCLHFWRHGGWRPLWLCDIAAMVETADAQFDWEKCLTSNEVTRNWIAVAIAAAHTLLNCRIDHLPAGLQQGAPAWIVDTILEEWRAPFAARTLAPRLAPTFSYLSGRIRSRWPNPVRAAFVSHRSPLCAVGRREQARRFALDEYVASLKLLHPWWWKNLPVRMRRNG